jgi:hypothetical protein
MGKSRDIRELFKGGSERLTSLQAQSRARAQALSHVQAALPPTLAGRVATAGLEQGKLTIGVCAGAWATRVRYVAEILRRDVSTSMGVEIHTVRVKVVQPPLP